VPDVARVINEITAAPGAGTPAPESGRSLGEKLDDRTLEVRVKLALSLNRDLKDSNVSVKAYRHEVTLTGDVKNAAQHALAVQTVTDTDGVERVVDQLVTR
jgi:osmotically-inducible protein OsmY